MSVLLRAALLMPWVLLSILGAELVGAGDAWPRFQGPPSEDLQAADLPLRWSPSENIAWKSPIVGYGQSSPVVWDGRVFVTSVSGEMKETCHVSAYDLGTGETLWQHDDAAASEAESSNYISKAAPTPVVDALGVVALFEGGDLIALSHEGKVRWQRDLVAEFGAIDSRHGLGSSLEQDEERIFVWVERQTEPYVMGVSKATGETLWKIEGLGVTSWSSPRLIPVEGKMQLVLGGIGKLVGLDPVSGKQLWSFDDISGNSTPTPIPLGDGRFLIGATTGNGDSGGKNAAASNGVVQIEAREDGSFQASWVWRAERATSSFGSPVAHAGFVYFVNRAGVVYCLDQATGEERYAKRSSGSVWATPIAVEDRLYFFGKDGETTVVKAGDDFEVLAENSLWSSAGESEDASTRHSGASVMYAAVAIEGHLLLRGGDALYLIGK